MTRTHRISTLVLVSALAGVLVRDIAAGDYSLHSRMSKNTAAIDHYLDRFPQIVYSAHNKWRQIFYDNANERGGDLMLVTMNGTEASTEVLVHGSTRDPDVSYDGKRVLFAWRGGESGTQVYRIFEMELDGRKIRQITRGEVRGDRRHNSDVEPIYLPCGDIMFSSTRMVQQGDCLDDESVTANLFLCDKDGNYIRRVGFDQAHTAYPSVLASGLVIYSRWDYNDKNHSYAHPLFIMNPDGSRQIEYYGNNSWWPTALYYPRQIPGTNKVMAIVGGYHSGQGGQVGIIDASKGIANGEGVLLLAPVRRPEDDTYGNWATSFSGMSLGDYTRKWGPYAFDPSEFPKPDRFPKDEWTRGPYTWPYPFDENAMLVVDNGNLIFMTADGDKHHIADGPCACPVPVVPREKPPCPASSLDWSKSTAVCRVSDVYITQEPLLKDIPRGTIKRLRVAALEYRTGANNNKRVCWGEQSIGPGYVNNGGASTPDPIARTGASWDLKWIIGETPVESDGSVSFYVPARTPVYFQLLDEEREVVQTMRSWATLMPGETFTCVGCHESKVHTPPSLDHTPIAVQRGPLPLEDFYGPPRAFNFNTEIQPILDAKCISCHNESHKVLDLRFGNTSICRRQFSQAYKNLVQSNGNDYRGKYVWWQCAEDSPLLQPPYRTGSCRSPLVKHLEDGHKETEMTQEEMDKIRCWIDLGIPGVGHYGEGFSEADSLAVEARIALRREWEEQERLNIEAFVRDNASAAAPRSPMRGRDADRSVTVLGVSVNPGTGTACMRIRVPAGWRTGGSEPVIILYTSAGRCMRSIPIGDSGPGTHSIEIERAGGPGLPTGILHWELRETGYSTIAGTVRIP